MGRWTMTTPKPRGPLTLLAGMDERPKKRRGPMLWLAGRSRRFWVVAVLMLPVAYVASLGPLTWAIMVKHWNMSPTTVLIVKAYYAPFSFAVGLTPESVQKAVHAYFRLWGSG